MSILCTPVAFLGTPVPATGIINVLEAGFTMADSAFIVPIYGVQLNDIIITFQVANLGLAEFPSGYTSIGTGNIRSNLRINSSYKMASGSETDVTFPHGIFLSAQDGVACAVYIVRGVDAIVIDSTVIKNELRTFSINGQPKSNTIFTNTANALVFSAFGATVNSDGTYTEPNGYLSKTDLFAGIPAAFPTVGLGVAARVRPLSGSEIPTSWTGVTPDVQLESWAALTIAIRMA